jgi:hypothetical protein
MLLEGGLEDPDDGLARRRGHLVLQHLGPQARIGAEGSQGVAAPAVTMKLVVSAGLLVADAPKPRIATVY